MAADTMSKPTVRRRGAGSRKPPTRTIRWLHVCLRAMPREAWVGREDIEAARYWYARAQALGVVEDGDELAAADEQSADDWTMEPECAPQPVTLPGTVSAVMMQGLDAAHR